MPPIVLTVQSLILTSSTLSKINLNRPEKVTVPRNTRTEGPIAGVQTRLDKKVATKTRVFQIRKRIRNSISICKIDRNSFSKLIKNTSKTLKEPRTLSLQTLTILSNPLFQKSATTERVSIKPTSPFSRPFRFPLKPIRLLLRISSSISIVNKRCLTCNNSSFPTTIASR